MSTEATVMFVMGAIFLWGGLLASILHYVRSARRDQQP